MKLVSHLTGNKFLAKVLSMFENFMQIFFPKHYISQDFCATVMRHSYKCPMTVACLEKTCVQMPYDSRVS